MNESRPFNGNLIGHGKVAMDDAGLLQLRPTTSGPFAEKWVYYFGECTDRDLLGGKGANLGVMSSLKLPVPTGFTISTRACTAYQKGRTLTG